MCWSFLPSSQNNTWQENDHIGQQTLGKQLQNRCYRTFCICVCFYICICVCFVFVFVFVFVSIFVFVYISILSSRRLVRSCKKQVLSDFLNFSRQKLKQTAVLAFCLDSKTPRDEMQNLKFNGLFGFTTIFLWNDRLGLRTSSKSTFCAQFADSLNIV